jgi:hypothetical protein
MSNTFNLQRFILLFKKHTTEHIKAYLLSTAVLFGAIVLFLAFCLFMDNNVLSSNSQVGAFLWVLILSGSIFTSLTFSSLGTKNQSIPTLMLPASHFEKFLVQWLYSFVIFQLVFLIVFFLADSIIISLFPSGIDSYGLIKQNRMIDLSAEHGSPYTALIFYALFHGLTLFGAVFFEKLHFIKTTFVFLVGFILLMGINQPFLTFLTGRIFSHNAMPFGAVNFTDKLYHDSYVRIDVGTSTVIGSVCALAITVILLWLGAFYRLKEKQV